MFYIKKSLKKNINQILSHHKLILQVKSLDGVIGKVDIKLFKWISQCCEKTRIEKNKLVSQKLKNIRKSRKFVMSQFDPKIYRITIYYMRYFQKTELRNS